MTESPSEKGFHAVFVVQVESVQLIADGKAPRVAQTEEGASYEGIQKKSNAKVRVLPRH